ncbi:hypothetical protein K450DRAFT_264180 [Umbelopsis ramanniana AG]|uniref:Uncharacterized protein n=1 Tax=Umbelopsis ramanniana AG TaxID=1314678 RepID=A0AAD5DZJ9_UMBRA|nr:uncharacterized protein K450DRAFT_264180 [Umbelopsis ramanniana AG]KAI8574883.1 hypothetical protein K450DRAFT_264180 [Umbelopsis ramanniana AG]
MYVAQVLVFTGLLASVNAYSLLLCTGEDFIGTCKTYSGTTTKDGNCVDWSSTSLNDKVESFYYQDSSCASIQFFQDKQCSGTSLGISTGPWQKIVTSTAGKTMSSAWIDNLGCYSP